MLWFVALVSDGKAGSKMQYDEVKELISIFEGTDLTDMEVELDNARVRLSRSGASGWSQPAAVVSPVVQKAGEAVSTISPEADTAVKDAALAQEGEKKVITAPIVGTFYQSSAPDKPPFVKVGDTINQGDVVCIIEAMKFMNEVNSEVSGTVTEILVEDGEFVEYGQELFRVK